MGSVYTIIEASLVIFLIFGLFAMAFYVVYVIELAKLFNRAGEAGWKAIILFYNTFILIKMVLLTNFI